MEISQVILDIEYPSEMVCAGIDPGQVNMGVALIYSNKAYAYQITLSSGVELVERITEVMQAVKESFLYGYYKPDDTRRHRLNKPKFAVVENAAYSAPFGQVPLAEARTAAVMGLMRENVKYIELMSPGAIRLKAFGSGKKLATDVYRYEKKYKDAITAIGCALAASKLGESSE